MARSEAYLRYSLALYRGLGNRAQLSLPLVMLGINLLFGGRFAESLAAHEECWAIHRALGIPKEPLTANASMARSKINLGRYAEARQGAEADLVRHRAIDHRWSIAFTLFNLGRLDLVAGATEQARARFAESAVIFGR